jgi:acyl carrier protein
MYKQGFENLNEDNTNNLSEEAMKSKLKGIMANIFNIKKENVKNNFSMETVGVWDSLKHMMLITAIEDEFKFQMTADEIIGATSYIEIIKILERKCNKV